MPQIISLFFFHLISLSFSLSSDFVSSFFVSFFFDFVLFSFLAQSNKERAGQGLTGVTEAVHGMPSVR
jgi:hypothetical protein